MASAKPKKKNPRLASGRKRVHQDVKINAANTSLRSKYRTAVKNVEKAVLAGNKTKATELFADPAFDGEPVQIYAPQGDDSPVPPDDGPIDGEVVIGEDGLPVVPPGQPGGGNDLGDRGDLGGGENPGKRIKYVIGDVPVYIVAERVQYYGADGKLTPWCLTRGLLRLCYGHVLPLHNQQSDRCLYQHRWHQLDVSRRCDHASGVRLVDCENGSK